MKSPRFSGDAKRDRFQSRDRQEDFSAVFGVPAKMRTGSWSEVSHPASCDGKREAAKRTER